ncbi:MAG: iron chelate uptake ABC transporter family permease subunit [Veillonella sp.]
MYAAVVDGRYWSRSGVSGVIMQAIVKNPLADPYIFGISSGASLGYDSYFICGVMFGENFVGVMALSGLWRFPGVVVYRTWVADQIR